MSRLMVIAPVLVSIALSAIAQLMLKIGMSSDAIQRAFAEGSALRFITAVGFSPIIIAGLTCYVFAAAVWLIALARFDLSAIYPFVALTILITAAAGYFMLGERVSQTQLVGMLVIVVGVVLMGTSIEPSNQATDIVGSNEMR